MEEINILELFGGIGALTKAFKRLGIPHKVIDYVEIDKYAVASYNAMNGTNFEPQDICKWDKDMEVDLIMHGSPCQDFSLAGKQAGGDEGSGTRSSLMYETIRIVEKLKPKYVIWENVKNLLSKKHRHNFDAYLETMSKLGYNSFYQVLNAKDYGIPQNRERVFTISILNSGSLKDISFEFPPKQELKLKLKDMLEEEVNEKYYLRDRYLEFSNFYTIPRGSDGKLINGSYNRVWKEDKYCGSINLTKIQEVGCLYVKNATKKGYLEAYEGDSVNLAYPKSETRRGRVGEQVNQTLQTSDNMGVVVNKPLKIRKLTPKECWRLMGFDDEDIDKASQVNSNTQLYKQAGNSIVVNVLEAILTNLLLEPAKTNQEIIEGQTTIFDYIGDSNE